LTYRIAYKYKPINSPIQVLGYYHEAFNQDHSESQHISQKFAISSSTVSSTRDQTFNYLEKYVSGKQPDTHLLNNSTPRYLKSNIQLYSKRYQWII